MKKKLPDVYIFGFPLLLSFLISHNFWSAQNPSHSTFGSLSISLNLPSHQAKNENQKILPSQLLLVLKGYRFDQVRRFVDPVLTWSSVPSGKYQFQLKRPLDEVLHKGELWVEAGEELEMTIVVKGGEHGPFQRGYHAYHIFRGGRYPGLSQTHYQGWIHSKFDSALEEIFHDGFVFWRKGTGETGFRFDADYDLVSDEEDPDDDNDGIPDHRDRDDDGDGVSDSRDHRDPDRDEDGILNGQETRDLMLGLLQDPVIEMVEIENLFQPNDLSSSQPGDVLRIQAKIHTAGGLPIDQAIMKIYQNKREFQSLELLDDGSSMDLEEDREGEQISGDQEAQDRTYTRLIALSGSNLRKLFPSVVVVEAWNKQGSPTNRWCVYLDSQGSRTWSSGSKSSLVIRDFSLKTNRSKGDRPRVIDYSFSAPEGSTVRKLAGSEITPLFPQRNALSFSQYFDTVSLQSAELFLLTVVAPTGEVFYVGSHF